MQYPFSLISPSGEIRRSGQTTRLIDRYIQELFQGEEVRVIDHFWDSATSSSIREHSKRFLIPLILKRLYTEHRLTIDSKPYYLKVDKDKLLIKIVSREVIASRE